MKIEKINDNQIRCTLTKEDLADRELKLSELAYGTDKAKSLFRDMMQQAAYEFGFEANDIPLMIEAIPLSPDCIILIITKVEDPDELDTRFSKFSTDQQDEDDEEELSDSDNFSSEGADDVLGLFKKIYEAKTNASKTGSSGDTKLKSSTVRDADANLLRLYSFDNLDTIIEASYALRGHYRGLNSLYQDPRNQRYSLVISKTNHTPEDFNRYCNILSEYGTHGKYSIATEAYLKEHTTAVITGSALQKLSKI